MDETVGRRELSKRATHKALRRSAMARFREQGFDAVSTGEIAAQAGVSPATLFNYFATKEDLFFGEIGELEDKLRSTVRDCRPGESILRALQAHLLWELTAGRSVTNPDAVASFHRLVVDSARLQARENEIYDRREAVLADELAVALGPEVAPNLPKVAAALYIAAQKLVATEMRQQLLQLRPRRALTATQPYVAEVFDVLAAGLGELPARV